MRRLFGSMKFTLPLMVADLLSLWSVTVAVKPFWDSLNDTVSSRLGPTRRSNTSICMMRLMS